jgi:hypothetical protein
VNHKTRWLRRLRRLLLWAGCFAAAIPAAGPAGAVEVWFSVIDPIWRSIHGWPPNDFMQLFQPDSPWQAASRGVRVFELYKKFVEQADDADLQTVIANLQQRHIALAIQGTPLLASQACGLGVEGYGPPHDMAAVAARVKRLGGAIAYVAFDEPLYYGRQFDRQPPQSFQTRVPTPCHAPIAELARQAAAKMAELHGIFPDAKIGDVEPVGVYPADADLAADLTTRFAAYKAASGAPLAFVTIDVVWFRAEWQTQFRAAAAAVRQAGLPLGVIYNGQPADATDAAWIADAKSHIELIEGEIGVKPNLAKFQSWTDHPSRILPETASDSFTGLVKYYLERQ